jgi:hypothetical protein
MNEYVEVEIKVTAADGKTASRHFEYRALGPDVEAAAGELRRGFIGSIDQRSREVNAGK